MASTLTTTKEPICMRIWGGLGNQMFQYAAGLATAQRLECDLLLDYVSSHADHGSYGLDIFPLKGVFWEPDPDKGVLKALSSSFQNKKKQSKKRYKKWNGLHYLQKNSCYAEDFTTIKTDTYIQGYFQSETFFTHIQKDIRKSFNLDQYASGIDEKFLKASSHPQSISVHIRRGDYVSNPKATLQHGILAENYYEAARVLMERLYPAHHWLVFSDDMEAADKLTRYWSNRTLVRDQTREEDLYLMTRCKNHVVANSSFSWWGTWLGHNPDKTVIAPRQWLSRQRMFETYIDDICPRGWILV